MSRARRWRASWPAPPGGAATRRSPTPPPTSPRRTRQTPPRSAGSPPSFYQPAGQPIANATNAANLGGRPAASYALSGALQPHAGSLYGLNSLPSTQPHYFTAVGTRAILLVSAPAYRTTPGPLGIGVTLQTAGQLAGGGTSGGYTNEASSHKTLRTSMSTITLVPGTTYTLRIAATETGTLINSDDYVQYMVIELP